MKKTLSLGIAVCSLFIWRDSTAQTMPAPDVVDNAGNVDISNEESALVQSENGADIFVYNPAPEEFRLGCDIAREDDLRSITVAYAPSTEQLYLSYITAGTTTEGLAAHGEGEGLGGAGSLASGVTEDDLQYQNAFWMIISPGEEPQPNAQEYAIIYADLETKRVVYYVYSAEEMGGSFNNQPYIGSAEDALEITQENGYQTVSMLIDVDGINAAFDTAEWKGTQFGENIGMWIQGGYNSDVAFGTAEGAAAGGSGAGAGEGSGTAEGGAVTVTGGGSGFTITSFGFGEDSGWHDTPHNIGASAAAVAYKDGVMALAENEATGEPSSFNASAQAAADGTVFTKDEFEQAAETAGVNEADAMRFGNTEEREQSYVWCTLLGNLVTVTPEAMNAWVIGPRWGFVQENTLEVECLGDLKIGIQTSDLVTGITAVRSDGKEAVFVQTEDADVDAQMQALEAQYGMSILSAAELSPATAVSTPAGGGIYWVMKNGSSEEQRFFDYGQHAFSLKVTTSDGDEHTIEHELILPRPPWPEAGS